MSGKLELRLLSPEEVNTIREKSIDLLSRKGVKLDHTEALKKLSKAGANVDLVNHHVRFPKDLIETALRTVPHGTVLAGINKQHDLPLPHPKGLFYTRTNTGARSYLDPGSKTYRDITLADVREFFQLAEVLKDIDFCCYPTPRDVPESTADIHSLKTVFENTSKHILIQPYSLESVKYLLELSLAVAGSAEALRKRPIIDFACSSITPLTFKPMDTEMILQSCNYGIPVSIACLPSAGGTAPATSAGTALLAGTEILAQLTMSQLFKPGIPLIGIPLVFSLDMGTGRNLQSSVESILTAATGIQFIHDAFHIPTHTYGFGTDSHIVDAQSTLESSLRALIISMAGCDILGGAGQLDVATVLSPIQLIIDDTIAGILKRVKAGIKVDEDAMAWEEISNTTPGGHFLESPHTLKHCRDALRPKLMTSLPMALWISGGSKDLHERAVELYRELKKELKPQQLDKDVQKELNAIVKKADERLAK